MKPEVAQRRIAAFKDCFGEAHYYFACHAAFPLALTPDLLYRLWANFQCDVHGESLGIPWMSVSDVLLSSLCNEVGHELYEMPLIVRNILLSDLKTGSRFGTKRIHELSDLLLLCVQQQLEDSDADIRDFAQAQRWTALAYVQPSKTVREIALALSELKWTERAEWLRIVSLVEAFAEPLVEFQPLLVYCDSKKSFLQGDILGAANKLGGLLQSGSSSIDIAGITLPIPEQVKMQFSSSSSQTAQITPEFSLQVHEEPVARDQVEANSDPSMMNESSSSLSTPSTSLASGADFSGANLQGRDFRSRNLRRRDFRYMDLSKVYFSGTDLRGADFTNAILRGANFSGADLRGADFTNAILRGANFEDSISGSQFLGFIGTTKFQGADLTDANFTNAKLNGANLKNAVLTRTRLTGSQGLATANLQGTYLEDQEVCKVLSTGYGRNQDLSHKNLRGVNLAYADLIGANFKGSNLNEAILEGADLRHSNLAEVQAIETNFTNAYLTGACLQSWNISSTTCLKGVMCDYVYLLEQPNSFGSRERRPSNLNEIFAHGDFEKLCQRIVSTIQIIIREGITPDALAVAFQRLMQDNLDITNISIQALEKIGNDVLLTLEVPEDVDKAEIARRFELIYRDHLQQLEAENKQLQMRSTNFKDLVMERLASSIQIANIQGEPIVNNNRINISGNVTGSTLNLGEISGTVSNVVNQLPDSTQLQLKEHLIELQAEIEAEPILTLEDKADALEEVKILAEAAQDPEKQRLARKAIKLLKGTAASLPETAKIAETCNKLLPLIAKALGVPVS